MSHALVAIAPIFLIIGLGALLRAKAGFDDRFWRAVERMTFYGLFPILLFVKTADADIDWPSAAPIAAASVGGILAMAVVALPWRRARGLDAPRFVALFQGGFRPNAYVGIAVILSVMGDAAAGPLAVCILTVAVAINVLGVWGHLRWLPAAGRSGGFGDIAIDCLRNPLIIACVAGGAVNGLGLGLPPVVAPTLDLLSRAALPLGLMAVGAGLSLAAVRGDALPVGVSSVYKLVLHPALTLGVGMAVGLEGLALAVPVVFAALPTSSTAYVVSRQMGSDAEVMAAIITVTHLAAIATIPALIALLGAGF